MPGWAEVRRGGWYWRLCVHGGEGDKGEGVNTYSCVHYPICVRMSSIFLNSKAILLGGLGKEQGLRHGAGVALWRSSAESVGRFKPATFENIQLPLGSDDIGRAEMKKGWMEGACGRHVAPACLSRARQ